MTNKKELKRALKLYARNLNSMANESIAYRERALKAEAMADRLTETVYAGKQVIGRNELITWYLHLTDVANEWQND